MHMEYDISGLRDQIKSNVLHLHHTTVPANTLISKRSCALSADRQEISRRPHPAPLSRHGCVRCSAPGKTHGDNWCRAVLISKADDTIAAMGKGRSSLLKAYLSLLDHLSEKLRKRMKEQGDLKAAILKDVSDDEVWTDSTLL